MRRVLVLLGAVVFVDTTFYAAITPLLPGYEEELDLGKAGAGILTAAYPAGTLLGAIPGGWLATRIGVKRTLLAGLALLAVSSVAFGFAEDIVALDVARFVQGLGGACSWAAALAWLVAAVPRERRGEALGAVMATAIAAGLTGPIVGVAADATTPELVFSGVAVVALALAVWALATPAPAVAEAGGLRELPRAVRTGAVAGSLWILVLIGLLFGVIDTLVPLRLDALGAIALAVGVTFVLGALAEAAVSPFIGRLSDERGRLVPLRIGLAAAAGCMLLLPLPETAWLLAALLVVTAPTIGFLWAPSMALLSDGAEAAGLDQALAFGLVNLAWGAGQAGGAAAGGAVAGATADAVPYTTLALLCLLTLPLLGRLQPRTRAGTAGSQRAAGVGG